jgi:hypothetical protein
MNTNLAPLLASEIPNYADRNKFINTATFWRDGARKAPDRL